MTIELTEDEVKATVDTLEYAMWQAASITEADLDRAMLGLSRMDDWPKIARGTAKQWRDAAAVVAKLTGEPTDPISLFLQIAELHEASADEYERNPAPEMPGFECNCPGCRAARERET